MKPRLYFDTSVFGGIYDEEFRLETEKLFEMVENGEIICIYSDLTLTELENAPEKVKMHFKNLPSANMLKVEIMEESFSLADQYIAEKVVGRTSYDDCLHIATATLNKVDYLVSDRRPAGILSTS